MSRQDSSERLEKLAEEGDRYYAELLRDGLAPGQTGQFVAIEPEIGRNLIGGSGSEALTTAYEAMADGLFNLKLICYDFARRMGGRSLRLKVK